MRQLKITKQITNRDAQSFNSYLTEVSNIGDTITSEQEIELAKLIKSGDERALQKLVTANLRFVVSVAKQYQNQGLPLSDLVNEGNIGMIKAAQRFDETRGFKFISYAVWWIRQAILQALAESSRIVRLPSNRINMINSVRRADNELEQYLERKPTSLELAEYLNDKAAAGGKASNFTKEIIDDLIKFNQKLPSLDAPMTNATDAGTLQEVMESDINLDTDKINNKNDLQIEVRRNLSKLKDRERDILTLFFGLFDNKQMTLEEIGKKYDLTRERVRQIKENAIRKLRGRAPYSNLKEYV